MIQTTAQDGCGCPDFALSRRRFLQHVAAAAGAGMITSVAGDAFLQAAYGDPASGRRNTVVVLSMRGGADGLSLVVPHGDRDYVGARGAIAIPRQHLVGPDAMFGLHPKLAPLRPMWQQGRVAAVHAVGLARPNRSHFAAMEEVEEAHPGSAERRGWINRLIGIGSDASPLEAVQVGSMMVPTSMYGPEPVVAMRKIENMSLPAREKEHLYDMRVASLRRAWRDERTSDGRGARAAIGLSEQFRRLAEDEEADNPRYPVGGFGDSLQTASRLIREEMGVEVIAIDHGSWDMHVNLGQWDKGVMSKAVDELATGLAAFFQELGPAYRDRVTVVTITEFGRRVTVNDNLGLDHGWANAMLVLGAGVRGGRYYGRWPGLAAGRLVDGDLEVTTDYRTVLDEVVRSRFDVARTGDVFPGFRPDRRLGLMQGV